MSRLIVLSDLHLPPVQRLGNFSAGDALAGFLQAEADRQAQDGAVKSTLVLAGDTVDFLLLPERPAALPWGMVPDLVDQALTRLEEAHPGWMPGVFAALKKFTSHGGELVLLPGNHDPEWLHPDTTGLLARRTGPVTIHRAPEAWQRTCGTWKVTVAHGDAWDALNLVPTRQYQDDMRNARESALPAGSRLVLKVFNPLKQALLPDGRKRFAFLDALKPEMPAVLLALLYLDAPLVLRHLPAAGGIWGKAALVRKLRALLRGGYVLEGTRGAEPGTGLEEQLMEDLVQAVHAGLAATGGNLRAAPSADVQIDQFERWLEEGAAETNTRTLRAAHNGVGRALLRAAMSRFSANSGGFFNHEALNPEEQAAMQAHLPPRQPSDPPCVFIAGHTHAARRVAMHGDEQNLYLNAGTWTDLVEFPGVTSGPEAEAFMDHLEAGTYPLRQRRTWVEVTPVQGPQLHGL